MSPTKRTNVEPKPTDILAGRGKATYTHPGNKRYLQLINESIEQYIHESTKVGKTAIVRSIVQSLQKEQRRFLQRDPKSDTWYELSRRGVLDKVGHSLRDMKQTKVSADKKLDKKLSSASGAEGIMDPLAAARAGLGFTSRLDAAARMPNFGRSPLLGLGGMMAQYQHPTPDAMLRQRAAALGPYVGNSKLDAILETTSLILKERAAMNRAMQMGGAMQHHQQVINMNALNMGIFAGAGIGIGMRNPNYGHASILEEQQQRHHAALQQARASQHKNPL